SMRRSRQKSRGRSMAPFSRNVVQRRANNLVRVDGMVCGRRCTNSRTNLRKADCPKPIVAALNAGLQNCELIAHFDYTKGELLLIGGDVPIVDDNGRLIDPLGLPGGTPEQDAEVALDATGYELILLGATKLLIAPASSTAAVKSRSDTECSRSAGDRSEPS